MSAAASGSGAFFEAAGLTKRFGTRVALDGVGFAVERGETLGLLGPNGAGKTTAFRALAGLIRIDGGELSLEGRPVDPRTAPFRRRLGVVFQTPSIDLKLSAHENLMLGAALYGLQRGRARERIAQALSLMDLGSRANELTVKFSGGMRRRVEVARILLHDPDLLLLDEPGQGIDPITLQRIWDEIDGLKKQRSVAVVVTTHQPEEAERCDRIAILDEGRVVATGTPDELRARVAGDVLHVRGRNPEDIATKVRKRLGVAATTMDGTAIIETGTGPRPGHELVPRVAELFPAGQLESIVLRRPTLADVFGKLTGKGFVSGEGIRP